MNHIISTLFFSFFVKFVIINYEVKVAKVICQLGEYFFGIGQCSVAILELKAR